MEERTVTISNISCQNCTATITREVGELPGVEEVAADHETKQVTFRWHGPGSWSKITDTLNEIGFPPDA